PISTPLGSLGHADYKKFVVVPGWWRRAESALQHRSAGGSGCRDLELAAELRDGGVLAEHLELRPHIGACERVAGGIEVDLDVAGASALAQRCGVDVIV